MKDFKFVELFAGIGGVSYGLEALGGKCVLAAEYDPQAKRKQFAQDAYKILHPNTTLIGDVCSLSSEDVPDHDVLAFTPPCQAFSSIGDRLGFEDTRGTLVFEALRVAKDKQPKVLLMENVKGLCTHDKGRTIDTILKSFNDIGYIVDINIINSKDYDTPQSRERTYIIGVRKDLCEIEDWIIEGKNVLCKTKLRLKNENLKCFNFNWKCRSKKVELIDIIEPSKVHKKYYITDHNIPYLLRCIHNPERTGKVRVYDLYNKNVKYDCANTLTSHAACTDRGGTNVIEVVSEKHFINTNSDYLKNNVRRFTPKECFKLQTFPDEVIYKLSEAGFSDTRLYKFAGNSVTVNVIETLGEDLMKYIN